MFIFRDPNEPYKSSTAGSTPKEAERMARSRINGLLPLRVPTLEHIPDELREYYNGTYAGDFVLARIHSDRPEFQGYQDKIASGEWTPEVWEPGTRRDLIDAERDEMNRLGVEAQKQAEADAKAERERRQKAEEEKAVEAVRRRFGEGATPKGPSATGW